MQPKEALIGGTINLGNYESFKFEFRGLVEKPEDYLDLAAFAAGSLLGQAAGADDATREQVRQYVGRVFGLPDERVPNVQKAPKVDPAPGPAPAPAALKEERKAPEPAKPAPEKKPTPTSKYTCEACGAPISATQQQMSQLFAGKTLCKLCFDKLREASK